MKFSSKELITQAAVGERQDIWDIYHCSVKGFLSCRCSSRTPAGSTTLAVLLTRLKVMQAHPLTFTHNRKRGKKSACYRKRERVLGEGKEDEVSVKVIFPCVLWVNSSLCSVWVQPGPHLLKRFYSSLPFADNSRHAVLWLPLGRAVCHVVGVLFDFSISYLEPGSKINAPLNSALFRAFKRLLFDAYEALRILRWWTGTFSDGKNRICFNYFD